MNWYAISSKYNIKFTEMFKNNFSKIARKFRKFFKRFLGIWHIINQIKA